MLEAQKTLFAIGTMDTKGQEVEYVAGVMRRALADKHPGWRVQTIDVSTSESPSVAADISAETILASLGQASSLPQRTQSTTVDALRKMDRSVAIEEMSRGLVAYLGELYRQGGVAGAIGLGGSGGTALIAPALRALPIGVPKLMVSTVASGNIAPYVGCSDLMMIPSIVDVSGLNAVSTRILANAANALVGMIEGSTSEYPTKPALAMTMFGVTTPCVTGVRESLEKMGFDCLVFHATGIGGQAMEGLVESGLIAGVLDLTTTEVADEVVGGVFPAGTKRFDVLAQRPIPCVLSVGALDMVNFGAMHTVPEQFRSRKLHIHNSNVTLMRTTPEENRLCASWMAKKLAKSLAPIRILLPVLGVSALDAPGKPFYDPEADEALFSELEGLLRGASHVRIERVPAHINDPVFISKVLDAFGELSQPQERKPA